MRLKEGDLFFFFFSFLRMVYLCLVYNFFLHFFSSFWWMMRSVQIASTASITQCDAFPRGVILHSFTFNSFFCPLLPLYVEPFLITSSKRERINTFFSLHFYISLFIFFKTLHNGLEVFYPSCYRFYVTRFSRVWFSSCHPSSFHCLLCPPTLVVFVYACKGTVLPHTI